MLKVWQLYARQHDYLYFYVPTNQMSLLFLLV